MMQDTKFRVIIIGAGPTGLYMALALHAANIDFVILEKSPSTFRERGNHLLIWPHTARLLDQLGLYEEAKRRSYKLHSKRDMLSNGRTLRNYPMWQRLEDSHGYPMLPLQRCDLLDVLYEGLPDGKKTVKTGSKVTEIKASEHAVEVHLSNGTVETGSVVVGADGTHSMVRAYIREEVVKEEGSSATTTPGEIPTTAHFCSIYGEGPNKYGVESGVFFETRDTGMGIQVGASTDMLRLIIYKKLPRPSTTRVVFTPEEMEEVARSLFDKSAAPGLKLRDIWPDIHKHSARLVSQEEGFAGHWHAAGRVVLTGDAAVTSSSVNGLGINCGLHSAALLASEIHRVVTTTLTTTTDPCPDSAANLRTAFARYQRIRERQLRPIYQYSCMSLRQMTWDSWTDWVVDRFVKPWLPMRAWMDAYVIPMVRNGQILSYVPFQGKEGPVPWRYHPATTTVAPNMSEERGT
ncbi:FAD/NAD(P)-binding domain-containing protein [Xylariaceae sp. FL0594]|nr:FAD/NAD(P)-binding domain-containing protein [Xylariaceae sp. FL0594]